MLVSQQLQQSRRQQQQAAALLLQQQQQQQKQQINAANEDVPAENDSGSSGNTGEAADADRTENVAKNNSEESVNLHTPSPSSGNAEAK
jgi:transcription initiation factor TFIID subunit TAF12